MKSIANKSRSVKGKKGIKPSPKPPRYTLKKDSLGRRYAIDKRTGQRVSVSKAEKERNQRKKARELFRGITVPKKQKAKTLHKKRSEAAKKGWETRRRKLQVKQITVEQIQKLGREVGAFAIPEGMRMHVVGGVADRAEVYPKVKVAADDAFAKIQYDFYGRRVAEIEKRPPPPPIETPRFDRLYGPGLGQMVRDRLAGAMDLADIDQMVEEMADDPDYDFTTRELYTLYFSPEVA